MKVAILSMASLAAGVLATPIRIITVTGSPLSKLHAFDALPASEVASTIEHKAHRPCSKGQKAAGSASFFPGPIGALLSRLGINGGHEEHHQPHHAGSAVHMAKQPWLDALKEHLEEIEGKVVPIMEGGMVSILPIMDENGLAAPHEVEGKQREHQAHPHHGHGHHHRHRKAHSFGGRLHRAINNLSSSESLVLAFVLGAGLGSILHFFFMVVLLTLRRVRHGRAGCAERRAARREARKARKAARNGGAVRLEGADALVREKTIADGEALPSYEEEESARLVQDKA